MALRTDGFQLSALPRAPDVPANAGRIDVSAIYNAVRNSISNAEALSTSIPRQAATINTALAQTQQAQAERDLLPARTAAAKAEAEAVPGQVGLRSNILSSQNKQAAAAASTAETQAAQTQAAASVIAAHRDLAKTEYPEFQQEYEGIMADTDMDPHEKAASLAHLNVKFPWLSTVYPGVAKDLISTSTELHREATKSQELAVREKGYEAFNKGAAATANWMQQNGYSPDQIMSVLRRQSAGSFPGVSTFLQDLQDQYDEAETPEDKARIQDLIDKTNAHLVYMNTPRGSTKKDPNAALEAFIGGGAGAKPGASAAPAPAAQKYVKGQLYVDKNGAKARWDGEKFVPVQ